MVQPVGGRRVIKVKAKPERVHRHLIKKHDRDRRAFVLLSWIGRRAVIVRGHSFSTYALKGDKGVKRHAYANVLLS